MSRPHPRLLTALPLVMTLLPLLLAITGCSATAMKSTPLWDTEYHTATGPIEDRVNVWPLFYYRKPAVSVLWPLISATDEGSAFVPFYEYMNKERDLRLGTIHPELFSLAESNGEKGTLRIFNIFHDPCALTVFPMFYYNQKTGALWILPVIYKGKHGFWTPLYTQTEHLKGVLGPLFFVHEIGGKKKVFFPFPFFGYWTGPNGGGFAAIPLAYHDRHGDESRTNIGLVLLHQWRDTQGHGSYALAGLAGEGAKGDKSWDYAMPLWFSEKNKDESRFISLPYSDYSKGGQRVTNAALNGYFRLENGDSKYEGYLLPFFHRFANKDGEGNMVPPLYYYRENKDGNKTIVTPLFGADTDGTFKYIAGPVFISRNKDGEKWRSVLWPLLSWWSSPKEGGSCVFPAYYSNASSDGGDRLLVTPLGGLSRHGESSALDVLGPLFYSRKDKDSSHRSILFPLWNEYEKGQKSGKSLFPLFAAVQGDGEASFYSLLTSFGHDGGRHFTNVGGLLFHSSRDENSSKQWLAAGLLGRERGEKKDSLKWWLFPLLDYSGSLDSRSLEVLLGLAASCSSNRKDAQEVRRQLLEDEKDTLLKQKEKKRRADPFLSWSRRSLYDASFLLDFLDFQKEIRITKKAPVADKPIPDGSALVAVSTTQSIVLSTQMRSSGHFFPIFSYETNEGEGSSFELLWRLFDAKTEVKDDGVIYARQRVLWRLFHRETDNERVAVDVFPFISYDRGKDLRQFSFAGGLFGFGSKEGKTRINLFWIPIHV